MILHFSHHKVWLNSMTWRVIDAWRVPRVSQQYRQPLQICLKHDLLALVDPVRPCRHYFTPSIWSTKNLNFQHLENIRIWIDSSFFCYCSQEVEIAYHLQVQPLNDSEGDEVIVNIASKVSKECEPTIEANIVGDRIQKSAEASSAVGVQGKHDDVSTDF